MNRHNRHDGSSRPAVLLARIAIAVLLVWLFWPVRITMETSGAILPRFENLVRVTPVESGMVCRVMVTRLQEVRAGEPLLEYIPAGKFSVLTYGNMTPAGGTEPEPLSNWYQKVESGRIARIEAANRWSARVLSQAKTALKWESDLAQRLAMTVPREADLMMSQAQQNENVRVGRENANKIYTFSESRGESIATEQGIPLASPVAGTLYSLWVQPRMQIFGSPAAPLSAPAPGGPPIAALYAAGSSPVAEIMPPGTPREVLALIPVPPRSLHRQKGWQAVLTEEGQNRDIPSDAMAIEFGRVSIAPEDAQLVVPELPVKQNSVFLRMGLPAGDPAALGSSVRVKLVSPWRPRVWFWLGEDKGADP